MDPSVPSGLKKTKAIPFLDIAFGKVVVVFWLSM
jgi:hypothetical protein